jgi:hypothetical protein
MAQFESPRPKTDDMSVKVTIGRRQALSKDLTIERIHMQIVSYFREQPDGCTIRAVVGTKKLGSG